MTFAAAPQNQPSGAPARLVQEYGTTAHGGFPLGSALVVPPDHVALIVRRGEALDLFHEGAYILDAADLPLLGQKIRLDRAGEKPVQAAIFLIRVDWVEALPWKAEFIITQSRREGITQSAMHGQAMVRVTDPRRFFLAVFQGASNVARGSNQAQSFRLTPGAGKIAAQAVGSVAGLSDTLLGDTLAGVALATLKGWTIGEFLAPDAREQFQPVVADAIANALPQYGVECAAVQLDAITPPALAPCVRCGSQARPATYAVFRSNVSLLHVRFTSEQGGNFCLPCGLQVGLGYTVLTLLLGWWGVIGFCLTPFFLLMNLFNMGGLLFFRKQPGTAAPSPAHGQAATRQ
jgi:hypothetical protein